MIAGLGVRAPGRPPFEMAEWPEKTTANSTRERLNRTSRRSRGVLAGPATRHLHDGSLATPSDTPGVVGALVRGPGRRLPLAGRWLPYRPEQADVM